MKQDPTLFEPRFLRSRFCDIGSAVGALVGGGLSLIGGSQASGAAEDAAGAQVEAARIAAGVQREGLGFQKEVFDVSRADTSPYRATGTGALGTLNSLFIPGGNARVQMESRLNDLRARRAVLERTGNPPPLAAPVQSDNALTNQQMIDVFNEQMRLRGGGASSEGEGGAGGPGGAGEGGGGGGGGGCFPAGTPIDMADGSIKPVELVGIGDLTRGGIVTAAMQFMAQKRMFDYRGVTVSGCHAVQENGTWTRVADADEAELLDEERLRTINRVYVFDTTEHRIHVAGVIFADYSEADEDSAAWADADEALLAGLQAQGEEGKLYA